MVLKSHLTFKRHYFFTKINLVKRRPKKRKGPPPPKPTDFVGEKPTWEMNKQKGNTCIGTTSAAVPCKDPIKVGKKCHDKYNWSNEGYIESEVHCLKVCNCIL